MPNRIPPWRVEIHGADPVPTLERVETPRDIFWIWFSGNLAVTSVVIGAAVAGYGLSLWQSLLALSGLLSYLVVGVFAVPGARSGLPTMILGREVFGRAGNAAPSLLAWLNLVGWETVSLVIAAYALQAVVAILFGTAETGPSLAIALALTAVSAFGVAYMGLGLIVQVQRISAYVFGGLLAVELASLLPHVDWSGVLAAPDGPWLSGVLPAFSLVAVASGLSWVNAAADYARYSVPGMPSGRIARATAWGGILSSVILMGFGVLYARTAPTLSQAVNPVGILERHTPPWLAVPFLLAAAAGMVSGDILDIYSGGLSLLAAGVRVPRSRTVVVDAVVSLALAIDILFVSRNFVGTFEAFLIVLGSFLGPWAGVFLGAVGRGLGTEAGVATRRLPRTLALVAWGAGVVTALLTSSTPFWSAPLSLGSLAGSSFGVILGMAVAYGVYALGRIRRASPSESL